MSNEISKSLFGAFSFNGLKLSNRIVMAPMTRSRAIGNLPNSLIAKYYAQRASAGLIITEGVAPSPEGLGYSRTPGIYSAEQTVAWKEITDAVHDNNSKIFMQLMHVGRVAHANNMPEGTKIIAPSAVAANGQIWTDNEGMQPHGLPNEMTVEEINDVIASFANAAQNAIDAGFDGIELHGANGYLLEQFLNPHVNQRTDSYGGSVENRARFVLEVAKAVAEKIGVEKTAIRLSPYNTYNDQPLYDEIYTKYDHLTKELNKIGVVYVHVIDAAARQTDEGLELLQTIRNNFRNILILNGGYTAERASEVINTGLADLVSFGSSFVSNPDLPHRLQHNIALTPPDVNSFFSADAVGFTDYTTAH